MKNAVVNLLIVHLIILFSSCGIDSWKTFEMSSSNDTIISERSFACSFGQVIYDFDYPDIYLNFTAKSDTVIEIVNCTGQVSWRQKKTIVPSPLKLSSLKVTIFSDTSLGIDRTFDVSSIIPDKFKKISGANKTIQYNLQFSDTLAPIIPKNVHKIYFDLTIETSVNGKRKMYKRTVEVDSQSHSDRWFIRDC